MGEVISSRDIEPGKIWVDTTVYLNPPQHLKRFKVSGLQAVWGSVESPEFVLAVYTCNPPPFMRVSQWFSPFENCVEEAREMNWKGQPSFPFLLIRAVRFICRFKGYEEDKKREEGESVLGFMRYIMEIERISFFLPLSTEENVQAVEHYHRC